MSSERCEDLLTLVNPLTGKNGRLVVVIRKYTPDVACGHEFQAPDWPPLCQDTLSELSVSTHPVDFGRQGLPGVQWPLPWTYQPSKFIQSQTGRFGIELQGKIC